MYSEFYRRCFQLALAVLLGYALYRVLAPFFGALGWAAVLAFILYPLHERLTQRMQGRSTVSAAIFTLLTPLLVLAPLSVLGVVFAGQVARLVNYLRGFSLHSYADALNRLAEYPLIGRVVDWARANTAVSLAQVEGWITDGMQTVLKSAAATGGDVALGVFGTLFGFFMMLFMLFFFLRDGRTIVEALTQLIPVERARRTRLLKYLGDVTRAVVYGSTATAVIAGAIVGVGYALVGTPAAVVYGVVGLIAAFLPSGASIVLVPGVLYRAYEGRWGAAIFLTCWIGVLLVTENLVRPLLMKHQVSVSTLAVFLGAIGGVAAYGVLGLVIGPVLLSFVVALVRVAQEGVPPKA
jgi:predicted PurR-regulated permease PerM